MGKERHKGMKKRKRGEKQDARRVGNDDNHNLVALEHLQK